MNDFRNRISVTKDELLNPEVCKKPYYWGFIAESLGIDHRILACKPAREKICQYLREMVLFEGEAYIITSDAPELINVKKRIKKMNKMHLIENEIEACPMLSYMIILNRRQELQRQELDRMSKAYGWTIDSKTGSITIQTWNADKTSQISTLKTITYRACEDGTVIMDEERMSNRTTTMDGGREQNVSVDIILGKKMDANGVTKRIDYVRKEDNEIVWNNTLIRNNNYPFVAECISTNMKTNTRATGNKYIALNKDNIMDLEEFQYVTGENDDMEFITLDSSAGEKREDQKTDKRQSSSRQVNERGIQRPTPEGDEVRIVTFENEEEMEAYFHKYKKIFGGLTNNAIRGLFIKSGLIASDWNMEL